MNCKDINELFTAYLDGEVTSEEQIQAHLSACQYCREELEALAANQKNLRHALKWTAAGATPSPQAWAGLRQRLDAGYLQRRPGVTIWGRAKSKVKGGMDTMIQGLVSRRPVWKTAVAGVLAVVLIAGLATALPALTGQSPEVLAAEIAQNSPQVQAFIAEGATLKEVVAEDNLYRVTFELFSEDLGEVSMAALVDIDELRTVRITPVLPSRTPYCPDIYLCEEALQKIVAEMVPCPPHHVPPAEPPITGGSLDRALEIAREVAYDDWCRVNITNAIIVAALWRWDGVRWVQVAQDYGIESNPCWRGRITAYARPICANPATGWHVVTTTFRVYRDGWRTTDGWQVSFPDVWLIFPEE